MTRGGNLVHGLILMMFFFWRAKATLNQIKKKSATEKHSVLKQQLSTIFDSPADREANWNVAFINVKKAEVSL